MTRPCVVMVHGLGGSELSLGEVPAAIAAAGWSVTTPRLPGHGTTVDELEGVDLAQWLHVLHDHIDQVDTASGVVIVGQSLGGVLALVVARAAPTIRGVVTINAPVTPRDPDVVEHLEGLLRRGVTRQPCGPPDLRDPEATDPSYHELPITAVLALIEAGDRAHQAAAGLRCPVLVVSSDHDQVVDPWWSDQLERRLPGPVSRRRLPHSGHVACRDLDRHLLTAEIIDWLAGLSAAST